MCESLSWWCSLRGCAVGRDGAWMIIGLGDGTARCRPLALALEAPRARRGWVSDALQTPWTAATESSSDITLPLRILLLCLRSQPASLRCCALRQRHSDRPLLDASAALPRAHRRPLRDGRDCSPAHPPIDTSTLAVTARTHLHSHRPTHHSMRPQYR